MSRGLSGAIALALLLLAACKAEPVPPAELPGGLGREAYLAARCWTCHRPGGGAPDFQREGLQLSNGFYRMVLARPDLACHEGKFGPVDQAETVVAYLAMLRDRREYHGAPRPVPPPRPAPDPALGRELYLTQCAHCHGETGTGDGPAAVYFFDEGQPRAFRRGIYRSRSTTGLPTDEDLFVSITRGMPGSAMPPHKALSAEDRWHLVDHLKSLAWIDVPGAGFNPFDREDRTPVKIPDPLPATPERIEAGRAYVEAMDCRTCHGSEYRGLERSHREFDWTDEIGRPIPRSGDLTRGVFKSGDTPGDLYRTIFLGRGGSPMTVYGPLFHTEERRWSIIHFVMSLKGGAQR